MESYRQTIDEVLAAFDSNAQSGLTSNQADEQRKICGSNYLTVEAPVPEWRKFLAQFTDVLVILLIAAGFGLRQSLAVRARVGGALRGASRSSYRSAQCADGLRAASPCRGGRGRPAADVGRAGQGAQGR